MRTHDTIIADKRAAIEYDQRARETNWLDAEVVFGLSNEFVKPGESLLNLGTGSGLASFPFHKAGLRVFGLDASTEILQICARKNFGTL